MPNEPLDLAEFARLEESRQANGVAHIADEAEQIGAAWRPR
jgi:hypothetical protein